MMQTQILATNMRWGGMTLKNILTLSCANAQYNYWPRLTLKQKCDDQIWNGRTNDHPRIDLNLMWNQSTCLNASTTLTKLPIMMLIQFRATNMRWGGRTLKSLQPCLMPMPNTTIGNSWLSHYNCQTEMWWPNLDWKRNFARDDLPTIVLNFMWNQSTYLNASMTLTQKFQ